MGAVDSGDGREHRFGTAAAACPVHQRRLLLLGDLPLVAGEPCTDREDFQRVMPLQSATDSSYRRFDAPFTHRWLCCTGLLPSCLCLVLPHMEIYRQFRLIPEEL